MIDTWFDSGSMPSAQHHYPFAGREQFESSFPADFICEAIDQTRGWFYSLLAVNTLVFDSTPFKNVVCLGLLVDEDGQKMSKSKGNVIDPWMMIATHGAGRCPAMELPLRGPAVDDTPRVGRGHSRGGTQDALHVLECVLVLRYVCGPRRLDPGDRSGATPEHLLDRWILSEFAETVQVVTESFDDFDALTASTRIATFVDDLSNWYVRRSRARFWKSSDPQAHATLHRCLVTSAELLAPLCPFLSDEIYVAVTGEARCTRPTGRPRVRAIPRSPPRCKRCAASSPSVEPPAPRRRRRSASRCGACCSSTPASSLSDEGRAEIADELNVKALDDIDSLSGLVSWTIVPSFRGLGPRLGAKVNDVKAALAEADGGELQAALERERLRRDRR